jgi:hypothetical protein
VNVLLVHHSGMVKINDVIVRSRNLIDVVVISASDEFVYTEGIGCKYKHIFK